MFVRSSSIRGSGSLFCRTFIRLNNTSAYNATIATIRNDLKINFRTRADVMEKNVIRAILSEVKNMEIKNKDKRDNDEYQLYELFYKMIQERQHTAAEYFKAGNPDRFHQLGENEIRECSYIQKYLQGLEMAPDEEVEAKVLAVIEEVEKDGAEVSLQNVYKKIPLKQVEQEWNCSKLQIKALVNKLLNLDG